MWGCVYPPSGHHLSSPTPIGDPATPRDPLTVHNRVSACAPDGQPKAPELKHVNNSHRFENLTWPEVNEAVEKGLIPILPVGTVEQHGPHLPIKMDLWTADSVANEAARRRPDRLVAMPVIPYGFTTHVMDFPGSVTVHHETFIRYVVDVLKSVVYHGFKKVIVVNGHGSNVPPLDLATRRVILETDAIVSLTSWWSLVYDGSRLQRQMAGVGISRRLRARLRGRNITCAGHRRVDGEEGPRGKPQDMDHGAGIEVRVGGPVRLRACRGNELDQHLHGNRGVRVRWPGDRRKREATFRGGGDTADRVGRRVPRPPIPRPQGPPRQAADYGCAGVGWVHTQ